MDKNNDKNILSTLDYAEKGKKGFKENNPGRPNGSKNKFCISMLEEAIELEEKLAIEEGGVGVFQRFARMAYKEPSVMIALMKKFVPDKSYTEIEGNLNQSLDLSGLTIEEIKALAYDSKIKNKSSNKKANTKTGKN